jgi:Tfp pilus assembly protein PilF
MFIEKSFKIQLISQRTIKISTVWIPSPGGNMRRFDESRLLTAIAVFALLVACTRAPFAQTQVLDSNPSLSETVQSPPPAVEAGFRPTTEDVGDALMARQRYQAAIETYQKASPDSADVWNKMGIAYQLMLSPADASRCYKESLKLNPNNFHALNNLGTVYDSLRQFSSAERMYRKALRLNSDSAVLLKNLGTNLLSQHKYEQGWESYKTALARDPHIFDNRTSLHVENPGTVQERGAMNYYMAKGCARAGQNDRAIDFLRRALNDGFANLKKIRADNEFAVLRGNPAFEQLLAAERNP